MITKTKKEINARPSQYQICEERPIIDWIAEGSVNDSPLMPIDLSQGQWTPFHYRNFKVWTVK
jgi:hypothetical protein